MTVVMAGDPAPTLTLEYASELIQKIHTEKDLASLFAQVENKAWWIEDNEYDFEVDSKDYQHARETTDAWFDLADILKKQIFSILKSEGIAIPQTHQIVVLEPFMKRNGYINGSGWWIKDEEC